jgi:hypothetical protein
MTPRFRPITVGPNQIDIPSHATERGHPRDHRNNHLQEVAKEV